LDLAILAYGPGWGDELLFGLGVTLSLAVISICFGTLLGLAASLAEMSRLRPLAHLVAGYNAVMRSLPELLVILFIYYGLSFVLRTVLAPFGFTGFIGISGFWTGVLAISMIHAAYACQVFRGAFAAVPVGPLEAAQALGLHRPQVFVTVKLPLAVRYALPGLMNLVVVTLKITPLVSAIGLQDLIRVAGDAGRNTKEYLTFYVIALLIYLIIAAGILAFQLMLERRLFRFNRA
jgi:His/Glu/Gln/Arg/opine family amino acid ABC transporter permease subunit